MTRTQLREIVAARPFVPFQLHLPDGRVVRVSHPELVLIPPADRTICAWDGEHFQLVDLLLVSDITFGRGRRRKSA